MPRAFLAVGTNIGARSARTVAGAQQASVLIEDTALDPSISRQSCYNWWGRCGRGTYCALLASIAIVPTVLVSPPRTLTAVMNFGIVITAAFTAPAARLEEESHCFCGRGVVAGAETPPVTTSE